TPVGAGGKRYTLIDPPADPPMKDRYRGSEFFIEGDTLWLFSSGSRLPRLLVHAKAKVKADPRSKAGRLDGFAK
ncbi:MAG: hypothetical protein ACYTGQ_05150, partial [Planctomycetota bacterium]